MPVEYDIVHWKDLFSEIAYAFETPYPPKYWVEDGVEYINFYKLTLTSEGHYSYKAINGLFDPKLWPRVKLVYKTFEENGPVDILYGFSKDKTKS